MRPFSKKLQMIADRAKFSVWLLESLVTSVQINVLPSWFITCCLMALLVVWSIFWILQKRTTSLHPSWTETENTNKGLCHAVCYPLSPNIQIQILQTDLYTFPLRISWENLIKNQGIFSDRFSNSHNLIPWQCMDIVRRQLMLITIGNKRV